MLVEKIFDFCWVSTRKIQEIVRLSRDRSALPSLGFPDGQRSRRSGSGIPPVTSRTGNAIPLRGCLILQNSGRSTVRHQGGRRDGDFVSSEPQASSYFSFFNNTSRNPSYSNILRDIFGNYRTGPYNCPSTDLLAFW